MRPFAALLLASSLAAGCHRSSAAKPPPAPVPVVAQHERADRSDNDGRAQAAPQADLEVVVNGKPVAPWTLARLSAAQKVAVTNPNGEQRDGWPLRDVTRALVGQGARVVALASDNERVTIDPRDWQDSSRTLLLRLSHRGEYKAQWLGGDGEGDEAFLKHIRRIEIAN
jgi:type IV secretory pathway VirJ component